MFSFTNLASTALLIFHQIKKDEIAELKKIK